MNLFNPFRRLLNAPASPSKGVMVCSLFGMAFWLVLGLIVWAVKG